VVVQYVSYQPPLVPKNAIVPAYKGIVNLAEFCFLLCQRTKLLLPQFKKLLVKTFGGVLWRLERLLGNFPPTYLLVVIDNFLSQSLFLLWLHFGIWLVRLQQQFLELIDSVLFVIDLLSNVLPLKSIYVLSVCELVTLRH
jgi:hypothetical protein